VFPLRDREILGSQVKITCNLRCVTVVVLNSLREYKEHKRKKKDGPKNVNIYMCSTCVNQRINYV